VDAGFAKDGIECCCGGFGFAGVAACLLQSAISTPVTINPRPVAVPPSPIKIGDMSVEDVDSPTNEISISSLLLSYIHKS